MIFDFLVLTIVIGYIKRGSLKNLSHLPLGHFYLLFIAFALQILQFILHYIWRQSDALIGPLLYILSFLPLFLWLFLNRHLWEMYLVTAGLFLNFLVITANGGRMPLYQPALRYIKAEEKTLKAIEKGGYYRYKLSQGNDKLFFLADYIPYPHRYIVEHVDLFILPRRNVLSPGDILMTIGICLLVYRGMFLGKKEKEQT